MNMNEILLPAEFQRARIISALANCNPFLRDRIVYERELLGKRFNEHFARWNEQVFDDRDNPNLDAMMEIAQTIVESVRQRWLDRTKTEWDHASKLVPEHALAFEDTYLFVAYHRIRNDLDHLIAKTKKTGTGAFEAYQSFGAIVHQLTNRTPYERDAFEAMPHYFAGFTQLRRAFRNIFGLIVGRAEATIRLRASVWQSIFTHDMRRYRTHLYRHMTDFSTMITGPSGTGKELVAQAIGLSRYIPYLPAGKKFSDLPNSSFFPIHLAALSPTLIESELFGHVKGSFTGAVDTRIGWFEACPATGSVFLDEIGELDRAIQVKLLRVLQQREFSRLGESELRSFSGKIIVATNRDLAVGIRTGQFREDLYYRLCSDRVEVPSLRARLDQDPSELTDLITFLSAKILDGDHSMAESIGKVILASVGKDYSWPGNVRELEQCIRNCLIRGQYQPITIPDVADPYDKLSEAMRNGSITADELIQEYCRLDYQKTASYELTGKRLNLDRRTVRAKSADT